MNSGCAEAVRRLILVILYLPAVSICLLFWGSAIYSYIDFFFFQEYPTHKYITYFTGDLPIGSLLWCSILFGPIIGSCFPVVAVLIHRFFINWLFQKEWEEID